LGRLTSAIASRGLGRSAATQSRSRIACGPHNDPRADRAQRQLVGEIQLGECEPGRQQRHDNHARAGGEQGRAEHRVDQTEERERHDDADLESTVASG
jgi:hypothetical protein